MNEQALEVGKESLKQISLQDPVLALLLILLGVVIVTLGTVVYKLFKRTTELAKEIDSKNDKMYEDAKADLKLILAFEQKLDKYLEKDPLMINDIKDIKLGIREIKSILELVHKQ
jgi:predicted Holliday junction resolvase-like endonuclease